MSEIDIQKAVRQSEVFDDWPDPIPIKTRIAEPSAYPVDALPQCLRDASEAVADFVKVDVIAPATVGLAIAAVAIGNKIKVVEREGLTHFPALFFVLIAASGERKSPTFSIMAAVLEDWIRAKEAEHQAESRSAKATNNVIQSRIKKLENDGKKDGANFISITREIEDLHKQLEPIPATPRMFSNNITEERLFQKMEERDGAYAVLSSEGRPVIDSIMGKHSGPGLTGDAVYLAGISGDTITRDRVGGDAGPEESAIYDPCLTVCIMVQPDKYMEASRNSSLRSSGALARIWPVNLPSLVGRRLEEANESGLDRCAIGAYENRIRQLLDETKEGQSPIFVTLSPKAAEARRVFHNQLENEMRPDGRLDDVSDITSKTVSQTVKIALVIQMLDGDAYSKTQTISLETWQKAQRLAEYHLKEAVRIQRLSGEHSLFHDANRLLSWLRDSQKHTFTITDITQQGPRPRPKADAARNWCDLLVEYNWIRIKEKASGRKKETFETNHALFSKDCQGGTKPPRKLNNSLARQVSGER